MYERFETIADVLNHKSDEYDDTLPTTEIAALVVRNMCGAMHLISNRLAGEEVVPDSDTDAGTAQYLAKLCYERTGHTIEDAHLIPLARIPVVMAKAYAGVYAAEVFTETRAKHYYDLAQAMASFAVYESQREV